MGKNKTLIILGNGFDLDLGWKTSYNDFFRAKWNKFWMLNRMPFIQNMVDGEYWYDLEGYIRQITITEVTNSEGLENLNQFWLILTASLLEYFNNKLIYTTNTRTCAFEFLKGITTNSKIVSFNYTNPFKVCEVTEMKIEYIHNSIASSYSNEGRVKLGIDSGVLSENKYLKNSDINYILKSRENQIGDTLISKWKYYDNIIIYGHSLGITDSDYFKPLFDSILSSNITIDALYIVTKDIEALESIKENLLLYDINYSRLLCSCNIFPVYTANGTEDQSFKELLQLI